MTYPRPAPHVIRWFLRTFGYGGITLPPLGIFILAERINEAPPVRHEQAHWAQYLLFASSGTTNAGISVGSDWAVGNASDPGTSTFRVPVCC